MKVLVTGGSGVIGEGVLLALLEAGHTVRLLSRNAERDVKSWPDGVEPFVANVSDRNSLQGAFDGCDAVVHIAGIVDEKPPEVTFERVNVEGTRNVVAEAERAGVLRIVHVSSLGVEHGESDYHRSKRVAEELVRAAHVEWVILRPGNVYGPGDEVISTYLGMFRTLPVLPVLGFGDQKFQPIWYRDLAEAIVKAIDMPGIERRTLELAGDELTTMNDLAVHFERITGRTPVRVPVPESVAALGIDLAGMIGVDLPINDSKLQMLVEENVVRAAEGNALTHVFGITPMALEDGLRLLADALPEQLPEQGFGALEQKRFWADIENSPISARELLERFRDRCSETMPVEMCAEPGGQNRVERGATLTLALPARGNVQVRVLESNADRITLGTIAGHPLAGVVRFHSTQHGEKILFEVETLTRSASLLDFVAMGAVGDAMQQLNWTQVVERVVVASSGKAPEGVQQERRTLDDEEARVVEEKISDLVDALKRDVRSARLSVDRDVQDIQGLSE